MSRSVLVGTRIGATIVALVACLTATGATAASSTTSPGPPGAAATPPSAAVLPGPLSFVRNLDLECFQAPSSTAPPFPVITTQHLNPVLAGLPTETHVVGPRQQVCMPVAKNNVIPPAGVLDFVRWVDLACYQITGTAVNFPLGLRHLNPVLSSLPAKQSAILVPEQLCLPVIKNNVGPPTTEIFNLVRYIDLKCYRVGNTNPLNVGLQLTQLNPVVTGIPPGQVGVTNARQLCVPVRKNGQAIPADVLNIVRWVDLEKYDTTQHLVPLTTLTLRHINPLLATVPQETVQFRLGDQLMLPVAKNNMIPPGP
ncbi:MAG TPA: hypothetical protein VGD67_23555 [Pseudonocardiaceae bacterium]